MATNKLNFFQFIIACNIAGIDMGFNACEGRKDGLSGKIELRFTDKSKVRPFPKVIFNGDEYSRCIDENAETIREDRGLVVDDALRTYSVDGLKSYIQGRLLELAE